MSIYVNALWSQFNQSEPHPHIGVHETLIDASANCDPKKDFILKFEDKKIAERYVSAFKNLCETAWSQNLSDGEMINHDRMIFDTRLLLEKLEQECEKLPPTG